MHAAAIGNPSPRRSIGAATLLSAGPDSHQLPGISNIPSSVNTHGEVVPMHNQIISPSAGHDIMTAAISDAESVPALAMAPSGDLLHLHQLQPASVLGLTMPTSEMPHVAAGTHESNSLAATEAAMAGLVVHADDHGSPSQTPVYGQLHGSDALAPSTRRRQAQIHGTPLKAQAGVMDDKKKQRT